MKDIHIGKKIKDVMIDRRMRASEFAERIGLKPGGISRLFARKELHCRQLSKISEALDHDFFQYYTIQDAGGRALVEQVRELKEVNESLYKENGYLKEINDLLKKNIKC